MSEESRPGRVLLSVCAAGFLAALALRLGLLFAFPGNTDSKSYRIVAEIAARGGDIYSETRRYNYSPAWGQVLRGLDRVREDSKLDLTRAVGLALTAADLATAALSICSRASVSGRGVPLWSRSSSSPTRCRS